MIQGRDIKNKILQNYFSIDGNVATLTLIYDTFEELVNMNFGDGNIEKLNDKLISDIGEAVSLLPRKFKLNIKIVIRDFGDYTKEECENIIKKNIYLYAYRVLKGGNQKFLSGCSLILAGAGILVLSYFLRKYDLWFDLINISGTLFVWEGVNMAFLQRNLDNKAVKKLAKSIQNITIKSEKDERDDKIDLLEPIRDLREKLSLSDSCETDAHSEFDAANEQDMSDKQDAPEE